MSEQNPSTMTRRGVLKFLGIGAAALAVFGREALAEAAQAKTRQTVYESLDHDGGQQEILAVEGGSFGSKYIIKMDPVRKDAQGRLLDRQGVAIVNLPNHGGRNEIAFRVVGGERVEIQPGQFRDGTAYGRQLDVREWEKEFLAATSRNESETFVALVDRLETDQGVGIIYADPMRTRIDIRGNSVNVTSRYFAPQFPKGSAAIKFTMPIKGEIDFSSIVTNVTNSLPLSKGQKAAQSLTLEEERGLGRDLVALSVINASIVLRRYAEIMPPQQRLVPDLTLAYNNQSDMDAFNAIREMGNQGPKNLASRINRALGVFPVATAATAKTAAKTEPKQAAPKPAAAPSAPTHAAAKTGTTQKEPPLTDLQKKLLKDLEEQDRRAKERNNKSALGPGEQLVVLGTELLLTGGGVPTQLHAGQHLVVKGIVYDKDNGVLPVKDRSGKPILDEKGQPRTMRKAWFGVRCTDEQGHDRWMGGFIPANELFVRDVGPGPYQPPADLPELDYKGNRLVSHYAPPQGAGRPSLLARLFLGKRPTAEV